MKKRIWSTGLALCLAFGSYFAIGYAADPAPSAETSETPSNGWRMAPYPSALLPCGVQESLTENEMRRLLNHAEQFAAGTKLPELMERSPNGKPLAATGLPEGVDITMVYRTEPANAPNEVPTLAVAFGRGVNLLEAHGLVWYDNGAWNSQPYPQAAADLTKKRQTVLAEGPLCGGVVTELHQEGNLMAAVVRYGQTQIGHEVQLLQRTGKGWRLVWAPTYKRWQDLWGADVKFQKGIEQFTVTRRDMQDETKITTEVWTLKGLGYERVK